MSQYVFYSHAAILTSKSKAADQPLRCGRIERWKSPCAARFREDSLDPDLRAHIAFRSIIGEKLCIDPAMRLGAAVST